MSRSIENPDSWPLLSAEILGWSTPKISAARAWVRWRSRRITIIRCASSALARASSGFGRPISANTFPLLTAKSRFFFILYSPVKHAVPSRASAVFESVERQLSELKFLLSISSGIHEERKFSPQVSQYRQPGKCHFDSPQLPPKLRNGSLSTALHPNAYRPTGPGTRQTRSSLAPVVGNRAVLQENRHPNERLDLWLAATGRHLSKNMPFLAYCQIN